jgi:hypothetical protein
MLFQCLKCGANRLMYNHQLRTKTGVEHVELTCNQCKLHYQVAIATDGIVGVCILNLMALYKLPSGNLKWRNMTREDCKRLLANPRTFELPIDRAGNKKPDNQG